MHTPAYLRLRNGYIIWSIVYILLSFIGGSINILEWGVNAKLLLVAALTFRVHLTLRMPSLF